MINHNIFSGVYNNKKVLVTGDTGFKGSWLSLWLAALGAKVIGYSLYLPSQPSNFTVSKIANHVTHIRGDVMDYGALKSVFRKYKPDFVFHLAAQPIVITGYQQPLLTFETNFLGTINVLECLRTCSSASSAVIITSDKCYRNRELKRGYRESDVLGGSDPYSASKACAELLSYSYAKSFFDNDKSSCRIATARAGNVIGGGDWAVNRIIPDCVRAWSKSDTVKIRNPKATRPWQHVLEPLSGYLWLGACLLSRKQLNAEAFNFGPMLEENESVEKLIRIFSRYFGKVKWVFSDSFDEKEHRLLSLSCNKAKKQLQWRSVLKFEKSVEMTADWYRRYYLKKGNMFEFSVSQIESYMSMASQEGLTWAGGGKND